MTQNIVFAFFAKFDKLLLQSSFTNQFHIEVYLLQNIISIVSQSLNLNMYWSSWNTMEYCYFTKLCLQLFIGLTPIVFRSRWLSVETTTFTNKDLFFICPENMTVRVLKIRWTLTPLLIAEDIYNEECIHIYLQISSQVEQDNSPIIPQISSKIVAQVYK